MRLVLEPKMQTLDRTIHGIVSRPKRRGTNKYNGWAWLMFTNAPVAKTGPWTGKPVGAYKLTQLSINMSRKYLYAGLFIRGRRDHENLRRKLQAENEGLLDGITRTLGTREWIIASDEDAWDSDEDFGFHDQRELRVALLDPKTEWVNARWTPTSPVVPTKGIVNEVFEVFRILQPVYALASNLETPSIPKPKQKVWTRPTILDSESGKVLTDAEEEEEVDSLMHSIRIGSFPKTFHVGGGSESYQTNRTFVPLSPRLYNHVEKDGFPRPVYLDSNYTEKDFEDRIADYDNFRGLLDRIADALGVDHSFFRIVLTTPLTDARKRSQANDGSSVLANLLRFDRNQSEYFWIVTVAREIAYLKAKYLSYAHQKIMRRLIIRTLSRWQTLPNS